MKKKSFLFEVLEDLFIAWRNSIGVMEKIWKNGVGEKKEKAGKSHGFPFLFKAQKCDNNSLDRVPRFSICAFPLLPPQVGHYSGKKGSFEGASVMASNLSRKWWRDSIRRKAVWKQFPETPSPHILRECNWWLLFFRFPIFHFPNCYFPFL